MVKSQIEDTFEKLVEQGATQVKKAAKSAVQQVTSTVSATKMWEQLLGAGSTDLSRAESRESLKSPKSHTPLNLEKLAKSYQNDEKQKTEKLKQHLHQLVKRGEEDVLNEKKKEEQEKKRKEAHELEMKKKKEEEGKKQAGELPQGKVRRSIFSHKKVAQRQHAELKPSSGKQ